MKKRIISFDLDNTLLDHADYMIRASALQAVERLRKENYIVLATGRDLSLPQGAEWLEQLNPDVIIHMNGTRITDGDKVLYEYKMPRELVKQLLDFSIGREFAIGLMKDGKDYYTNPEQVVRFDMRRWGWSKRNFADPYELLNMDVYSLVCNSVGLKIQEMEAAFPQLKFPPFSAGDGTDVFSREVSKAVGLKRVCDYLGIPMSGTVAFGDSLNDYEIIQAAGTGVAMGNAVEPLKQVADYVTDRIGDDGIWNACVKLGLF